MRHIGIEICKGLEHANEEKVIHRDIKPGNILLAKNGEIKIADFGIARECRDSVSRLTSQVDSGTLLYMSPEQLDGKSSERSDIYSLGVMLYEMLSGGVPFRSGDIVGQIRKRQPKPLRGVSEEMNTLVLRCLAKKPQNRPKSVKELYEELGRTTVIRRAANWHSRGVSCHEKRDYDRAIADGSKAIELDPKNAEYWDSRAEEKRRKRQEEEKRAAELLKAEQDRLSAEEQRKAEEARRRAEEQRKEEERRKQAELDASRRKEEERLQHEEAERKKEETTKVAEAKFAEELKAVFDRFRAHEAAAAERKQRAQSQKTIPSVVKPNYGRRAAMGLIAVGIVVVFFWLINSRNGSENNPLSQNPSTEGTSVPQNPPINSPQPPSALPEKTTASETKTFETEKKQPLKNPQISAADLALKAELSFWESIKSSNDSLPLLQCIFPDFSLRDRAFDGDSHGNKIGCCA